MLLKIYSIPIKFQKKITNNLTYSCPKVSIPVSLDHTHYWLQAAAIQGIADAQYNLAGMYLNGQGGVVDLFSAKYWYQQAANQGHTQAKNELQIMDGM